MVPADSGQQPVDGRERGFVVDVRELRRTHFPKEPVVLVDLKGPAAVVGHDEFQRLLVHDGARRYRLCCERFPASQPGGPDLLRQPDPPSPTGQRSTSLPSSSGLGRKDVGRHYLERHVLSPAWQHAAMVFRHPDGDYAITAIYSVPDDAWHLELDLVAGQRNLVTATIPDEDPAREPTVRFNPSAEPTDVPYEVMRWFMHQVDEEIRSSRAWMRLRPELVEIVYQLRQEHMGVIDDDDFPQVLADVRTTVPEEDIPAVLEAAFGRNLTAPPRTTRKRPSL